MRKVCQITDQKGISITIRKDARNGNVECTLYNMDGNLVYRRFEDRKGRNPIVNQYIYYPDGKLKEAAGGGITYCYTYTDNGLLKNKSASGKTLLEYDYDSNRNLTSLADSTGNIVYYSYDMLNRLKRVSGGREDVLAAYDYTGAGQIRSLRYGNGVQTEYRYQDDGELSGLVTLTEQGQVLLNFDYAYDGNGNCVRKSGETYQNEYAYDHMNRLVSAVQDGQEEKYAYDPVGNRLKKESVQGTEIYSYNAKNQLTHIRKGEDTLRYLYDNQGNLLEERGKTRRKQYSYDAANRQVGVVSAKADGMTGQLHQSNRYDGEGLRYETEENGKVIRFLFDRGELAQETQDEEETSYARGYRPISLSRSGKERSYFVQDEMGSTLFLLDQNHEIQKTYRYDAFGNILKETGDTPNRLAYTGQMYDGAADQYYLRARFYNPSIGRFMQEDTYRGDGLNLYAYCANNPVMYYDPSGHIGICPNGKTYPAEKENLVPDMIPGPNGTLISKEYDQLVYGGFYTNKAYNRMRFEAQPGDYQKHVKATTMEQAIELSQTQAQYIPGIDNNAWEYKAMFEGIPVSHGNGTIYYFYDTGQVIGFDGGLPTTWIRAELSSGFYHGHPISTKRVGKYITIQ